MVSNQIIDFGENNSFCILSDDKKTEFEHSKITEDLIVFAEHGLWQSSRDGITWIKNGNHFNIQSISNLAEPLLKVLNYYSNRVPFSKIEVSEELISWKFEGADQTYAEWISSELQMNLEKFIGHLPLKVLLLFYFWILRF